MIKREVIGSNKDVKAEPSLWEEVAESYGESLTPHSFGRLYDAYFSRIFNYLAYRTATVEEAEDLTAQVFERVITRYRQFDPRRGSFESWLFGIARHTLYNQTRHRQRHPDPATLDDLELLEDERQAGPADLVLKREELARLHRYIQLLNERDRELLALRYGANLSQRRIGELLGMTEANVAVAHGRALRRLRHLFAREEAV